MPRGCLRRQPHHRRRHRHRCRHGGGTATAAAPEPAAPTEPGTGSRLAAAKAAVAAEAPARTPDTYVADDSAASTDDEDIAELGEVGRPVIERLLGGKVIDEGP